MKNLFCITLLCSLAFISVTGQPYPAKFGKIDMADLQMKVYDLDTTAEAVILCDFGEFNSNTFDFYRLLRIKILKKEGLDIVNRVFYINGTGAIKGCTYNLVNGEIVESKLKSESIFKEEVSDDRWRYRVTMPDVKVGSIVDIQYTFPLLPNEWRFQDEVPVRWSELRIGNSPYITFQKVFFGFEPLFINESGRWVGKNMPALRNEPYVNSLSNYLTKVEIELQSVTFGDYNRFYTTSWDAVNKYLLNNKYFGVAMGMGLFLNEDAKTIKMRNLSDLDKMKAACELIKKNIKWNDEESLYATADLAFTYRKGSGNSADVNLCLVQLLKRLDFDAFPIALSTRENGILSPAFPTIDKLNYVVAGVKYNDKYYFFDATEPNLSSGMLPFRALNGRGRIISDKYSDWIDLVPSAEKKETVYCDMKLSETGEMTGIISYTDLDYEAYYSRNNIKGFNSKDEYIKDLESSFPGLTINSCTFEDLDSLSKPLKEKYEVSLTGYADIMGDMISISPMLIEKKESNPFKLETRKYPIDYGHATKSRYILNILLPDGYEVAELPKPCSIVLPDKSARFNYNVSVNGNAIQLITNFDINKTVYVESEYIPVKEFYNQVIAKQMEVIMIKKKAL
jgi:hypothetical protein